MAQVLGSVALFAFLTQVFTGILLAVNYAPTLRRSLQQPHVISRYGADGRPVDPRAAPLGRDGLMIIVVVLHMLQVFPWGAYGEAYRATWMVGVVLLLLTLAYGLTGYLLPGTTAHIGPPR